MACCPLKLNTPKRKIPQNHLQDPMSQAHAKSLARWNTNDTSTYVNLPHPNEPQSEADTRARTYIKLDAFQSELQQVEVEASLLLAKRARLLRQIVRCETELAPPWKDLPAELIMEIISAAVAVAQGRDFRKNEPRLVMTQICSSWRRAAFDVPDIWEISFPNGDPPQDSVRLASSWLSQCSSSALCLHTGMPWDVRAARLSWAHYNFLTELVVPYSRRIATLDLDLDVTQWNTIRSLPFDRLVTLYLPPGLISSTDHPGELACAPSLRTVYINWIGEDNNLHYLPPLLWAQLTEISLSGSFPVESIPQFISRCTSLKFLDLGWATLIPTSHPLDEPIHLPHLESLLLTFASPQLFDLLSLFKVPCLSSLKLNALPMNEEAITKFTRFISSISGALRHFEIAWAEGHCYVREEYISPMSSVTRFVIPYLYFLPLHTLVFIGTRDLLPNVEHLGFSVSGGEVEVVDMLLARHTYNVRVAPKPGLKKVEIVSHGVRWGDEGEEKLEMLRSQGMEIKIVCTGWVQ